MAKGHVGMHFIFLSDISPFAHLGNSANVMVTNTNSTFFKSNRNERQHPRRFLSSVTITAQDNLLA